jgi:two-component system LytT family response regulator
VVKLDDIVYCEAETSYTIFHLINGKRVMVSKPIIEYEALLQNTSFCRVHKSFMINMSHIKEYIRGEGGTVMLSNSREVEVSRRKKDVFISKLKEMYRY